MKRFSRRNTTPTGFTIVELLVVIVIIAILAAITIVAYTGISQRAVVSLLQSDLSNAVTAIKAFQIENSNFPITISTDCNTSPDTTTNKCLKISGNNSYIGYAADNVSSPKTFLLIGSNGNTVYKVTEGTAPTQLSVTSTQPGITPGALAEYHAAKASGGSGPGINSPLTTTWSDTGGGSHDGTLVGFSGSPWLGTGVAGDPYRLSFSGSQQVTLPTLNFATSKAFTIESWFYSISSPLTTGAYQFVAAERGPTITTYAVVGFCFYSTYNDGRAFRAFYRAQDGTSSALIPLLSAPNLVDGALHHAVLTSDGINANLYIDNALRAGPSAVPTGNMVMGAGDRIGSAIGQYNYTQPVVSYRVYPFALTASQVSTNYNAGVVW